MTFRRISVLVGALGILLATAVPAFGSPSWPVYNGNAQRTGNDTSEPALLPVHHAWSRPVDSAVYAQPLVYNGRVFTATENNTVYALDAHDGAILWSRHLGTPMTNVAAQSGCGNVDPLGILSTPVIDTNAHTIFVVATIQDSFQHIHHQLMGLDTLTGALKVSANADPGPPQNSLNIQQRAGLALGNGRVYIGYGGYSGDCGPYHGWLVSLDEGGSGKVAFNVTPTSGLGAIWATGGATIDTHGNVYVSTGNPDPDNGNFGESVLKFDNTPAMHRTGAFKTFPGGDNDLSSVAPSILPNSMLFQIGKQQTGFLVDTNTMTSLKSLHMCDGVNAFGTNAFDGSRLFVPCLNHIQEVNIDVTHRTMSLGWTGPSTGAAGSPILAAGSLWSIDRASGTMYVLDPATGAVRKTFAVGPVAHFAAPASALGLVLVPTLGAITAYAGPSGVPPHAPEACLKQKDHNGYWVAGSDGNLFPFGGAPSCGSLVGVPLARPIVGMAGRATAGYWMVASDGGIFAFGDAKFRGSMGGQHLNQPIVGMAPTRVRQRLLVGRFRRRDLRLRRRQVPRVDGRSTPEPAHRRDGFDTERQRLLVGGLGRRDLRLRRRAVPRIDGRSAPEPADGRHGAHAVGSGLLDRRRRRRCVLLRRRGRSRARPGTSASSRRSWEWRVKAPAIASSPVTAECSRSACRSAARPRD